MTRSLKHGLMALPAMSVSLLPKLTCPICWPAYAGLLTSIGLGFLLSARYLLMFTSGFLLLSVAALAFRAKQRRGYAPAFLGLIAGTILLLGKFLFESGAVMYGGLGLLIVASIWNGWPRSRRAPATVGLVQLSANETRSL